MKPNNLIGQRFGRLVVTHDAGRCKKKNVLWGCRCDCGGVAVAHAYDLRAGKTASCGCIRRETTAALSRTHAMSKTRVYRIWSGMISRCKYESLATWERYGGRGVTVYAAWLSFDCFYADMGDPPKGYSLERVDNDGPYAPWNCKWATHAEQCRNKSSNVYYVVDGVPLIQTDAARLLQVRRATIREWRKRGMTDRQIVERAKWLQQKRGL